MASRRGKTQARRHSGNGLPGWAWALIGALIAVVLVLAVPRWLDSKDDADNGPQPNPDAQPAPVASGDGLVEPIDSAEQEPEYDFYTLLPGKEVRLSDAELAAQERAEAQEQAATDEPLPQPVAVDDTTAPPDSQSEPASDSASVTATTPAEASAAIEDGSRYLLQAGAFQSAQQAEALKARIALLGLAAWVEPVTIDGKLIHRVRMGPYDTAGALADAKRKLANRGLPGMAIKVK